MTHRLEKVVFIGTIIWCLVLVNKYHNFPLRLQGQKIAQPKQTICPLFQRSLVATDRVEISPISWSKGIRKILRPVPVMLRNQLPERPKHFLPRIANYVLYHLSVLSEQFRKRNELSNPRTKLHIFPCARCRDQFARRYLGH